MPPLQFIGDIIILRKDVNGKNWSLFIYKTIATIFSELANNQNRQFHPENEDGTTSD
jgi:hypothetical protein